MSPCEGSSFTRASVERSQDETGRLEKANYDLWKRVTDRLYQEEITGASPDDGWNALDALKQCADDSFDAARRVYRAQEGGRQSVRAACESGRVVRAIPMLWNPQDMIRPWIWRTQRHAHSERRLWTPLRFTQRRTHVKHVARVLYFTPVARIRPPRATPHRHHLLARGRRRRYPCVGSRVLGSNP